MPAQASSARVGKPRYFARAAVWRKWLAAHHDRATELWVELHRRTTGRGMSWPEAVDEALCFGWIDAVRRGIDAERYAIRFTRRRPGSIWSKVNLAKAEVLVAAGKMQPAGLALFAQRTARRTGIYSFEQPDVTLDADTAAALATLPAAAAFFAAQAPWYRRKAAWWVQSAKQPATRRRRRARLVELSAAQRQIP